jgi:glycosyltransferase involved in cell wall biosynthesis
MRVILLGKMKRSPICTSRWISRALTNLGHEVIPVDFSIPEDLEQLPRIEADVLLGWSNKIVDTGKLNCPKALWFADEYELPNSKKELNKDLTEDYDHIYTVIAENIPAAKKETGTKMEFLPPGVDMEYFWQERNIKEKIVDLSFIGNITGAYPHRNKFIQIIKENFPEKELLFGQAGIEEMVKIYNHSKIVFNIGYELRGCQLRIFEAPACGSFLLTNDCLSLRKCGLKPAVYTDADDLVTEIKRWLNDAAGRREKAQECHSEVLRNHSWEKRIRFVLNELGLN